MGSTLVYWANFFADGSKIPNYSQDKILVNNKRLAELYQIAKQYLPEEQFIKYPEDLLVADKNHKWGQTPFHFQQKVYEHFIKQLDNFLFQKSIPLYLLNNYLHVNRTKYLRYDLLEGKYTYQYLLESLNFIFYAHFKKNSQKLTIFLPGATNRKQTIHNFQRFSWSDDVEGSIVSFLDPTITLDNEINIGWFQGKYDHYAIPMLVDFIKELLKYNNISDENLTIFGSSAGGFSSLKIADDFPNSRIIVINPQTRVYDYIYDDYKKLVNWLFPDLTPESAKDIYFNRLTASVNLRIRTKPIFYYQNTFDDFHVKKHLNPMLSDLTTQVDMIEVIEGIDTKPKTNRLLKVIYYADPISKHNPPNKAETIKILDNNC